MASKKASSNGNEAPKEGGHFRWDAENDNKLLLLVFGRHVSHAEFDNIAKAFPGITGGAVRNRLSVMRGKQKDIYKELGWPLPGPPSAPTTRKDAGKGKGGKPAAAGSKRAATAEGEDGEDDEAEVPVKKARVVKKKKKVEFEENAAGGVEEGVGVKQAEA